MGGQEKKYSAPALEKGLDIIELLSEEEFGLSQSAIARMLSRSVGEIFRMLAVLEQRGYVAQDGSSGRYVLTTFLFELAHRLPNVRRLTAIAGPRMRQLASEIRQSVHLGIVTNDEVLVVGQVDSPSNNVMSVRLGAKIELWNASSGRVIVAYETPEEIDRHIEAVPLPSGMQRADLDKELRTIREVGHEVRDSFVVRGVVNIAVPVFDHSGKAVAALTVPHIERTTDKVRFETCVEKAIASAHELSQAMGAGGSAEALADVGKQAAG
ncbi:MAG: IclR family transcriptional regulator [Rhizobiaceae bacterium]|nr:IclR family transcriptional regulator [Rhizobiaceae bacterium]